MNFTVPADASADTVCNKISRAMPKKEKHLREAEVHYIYLYIKVQTDES